MFKDRYRDRIANGILLLTASSDDNLLPLFYQELGGKQRGESERVILQREVDQSAYTLYVLAFKVSPYFNCACATLIYLNKNKQNGSHNTPLKELGRDQFSPLQVLLPRIRIKYTSLIGLVMLPQLCIGLL
jgi:hypothetical protein